MPLESCTVGHGASKSSRNPKIMDYSPRKWPKITEITFFDDAARVIYLGSRSIETCIGGHGVSKSFWDQKTLDYSPRKWPKCVQSRVLTMPLESCTGGHGASKSSRNPITEEYSTRKWPKMPEITSFDDAARVIYRG